MDFLRDPVWTFIIGIAITAIVGAGGIYATLWVRNRKALSYEVVSDVPLVTISHGANNSVTEALEIRYNGSPVHDVRLLVVRVWNSGNKEIVPTDYDEPLMLQFGGQLLASDVIESTPLGLKKKAIAGGGIGPGYAAIAFHNLVLNPRDSITVQALLTDFTGDVSVEGHIVGIPSIRRSDAGQITGRELTLSLVLGSFSIIGIVVGINVRSDSFASSFILGVSGVFAGAAFSVFTPRLTKRLRDSLRRR